jgi:hypothetical protein
VLRHLRKSSTARAGNEAEFSGTPAVRETPYVRTTHSFYLKKLMAALRVVEHVRRSKPNARYCNDSSNRAGAAFWSHGITDGGGADGDGAGALHRRCTWRSEQRLTQYIFRYTLSRYSVSLVGTPCALIVMLAQSVSHRSQLAPALNVRSG